MFGALESTPYRTTARRAHDATDPDVTRFGASVRRARRARQTAVLTVLVFTFALGFVALAIPRRARPAAPMAMPTLLPVRVVLPGPWLCPTYPADPAEVRQKATLSARDVYGIDCTKGPWY